MGVLNLLKANWTGKVGQTVGAKWKNKSTIRSYTKPAYTNTPAQQIIRAGFGEVTSFVALFSDQIRSLSALDTKGMSVRNAIIKLNKDMIQAGSLSPNTLQVSRGGLPKVTGFTATIPALRTSITANWTAATGATISDKARLIVIAANSEFNFAAVGFALNSAGTVSIPCVVPTGCTPHVYFYLLDYRGSSRVASPSDYFAL